jgi:ribonuclease HI
LIKAVFPLIEVSLITIYKLYSRNQLDCPISDLLKEGHRFELIDFTQPYAPLKGPLISAGHNESVKERNWKHLHKFRQLQFQDISVDRKRTSVLSVSLQNFSSCFTPYLSRSDSGAPAAPLQPPVTFLILVLASFRFQGWIFMYALKFDGSFRGVPRDAVPSGLLGYGWLVTFQGLIIAYGYGIAARGMDATSNVAEYLGLIDGLEALVGMGIRDQPVLVLSDSNVIIHRMNGYAGVGTFRDEPLHSQAVELAGNLTIQDWRWIPRQVNYQADALSKKCYYELLEDQEGMQEALETIEHSRSLELDDFHYLDDLQIIKRDDLGKQKPPPAIPFYLTSESTLPPGRVSAY